MSKSLPIIGLTPQLDIQNDFRHVRLFPQYQRSIEKAGGIGIMLPLTEDKQIMQQLADLCDGFIFTGGQDLDPFLYGEKEPDDLSMTTGYAPERDRFESAFYPIVKATGKPILAICRGFQIINVLHGGTIDQDLPYEPDSPDFVLHPAWSSSGGEFHPILIKPGSQLHKVMNKSEIDVNSFHHQGIKTIGKGLTVSGTAPDGLIEAFDIDGLDFGIAVQWHPEVLFDSNEDSGELFKALINASNESKNKLSQINCIKKAALPKGA